MAAAGAQGLLGSVGGDLRRGRRLPDRADTTVSDQRVAGGEHGSRIHLGRRSGLVPVRVMVGVAVVVVRVVVAWLLGVSPGVGVGGCWGLCGGFLAAVVRVTARRPAEGRGGGLLGGKGAQGRTWGAGGGGRLSGQK